jgi:hypothetical protein
VRAVLLLSIAAAALACGSAAAATWAPERPRAQLVISSLDPLVVRGTGFLPGERVKLLVSAGGRSAPTGAARASGTGRFTARLKAAWSLSGAVVVQALGARGSRATVDVSAPTGTLAPSP